MNKQYSMKISLREDDFKKILLLNLWKGNKYDDKKDCKNKNIGNVRCNYLFNNLHFECGF